MSPVPRCRPRFALNTLHISNPPDHQGAAAPTLRELFDREEGPLLRYAMSMVDRRAVAEEIVQEAFLKLHTQWDDVESPRGWLYRTVRNQAFNFLRDNRRIVLTGDQPDAAADRPDQGESPAAQCSKQETLANLRVFVEELGEQDRLLIQLKYFEHLKYREISQRTGLTIGNVGYRLHHLLKGLADRFSKLGIDDSP